MQKNLYQIILRVCILFFLISGSIYFIQRCRLEKREADFKYDSEKVSSQDDQKETQRRSENESHFESESRRKESVIEEKRIAQCNEVNALECFNKYMSIYYPDWQFHSPSVSEKTGCIYLVTFNTINPHFDNYQKSKVHVVEIRIDVETGTFTFESVRNRLY